MQTQVTASCLQFSGQAMLAHMGQRAAMDKQLLDLQEVRGQPHACLFFKCNSNLFIRQSGPQLLCTRVVLPISVVIGATNEWRVGRCSALFRAATTALADLNLVCDAGRFNFLSLHLLGGHRSTRRTGRAPRPRRTSSSHRYGCPILRLVAPRAIQSPHPSCKPVAAVPPDMQAEAHKRRQCHSPLRRCRR
jgi:hypothetical protein